MSQSRAGCFQERTAGVRLMVGDERIALCGELSEIRTHHHAASAVVVGVDGPVRIVAGRAHTTRAVLIAPGFAHAVEVPVGKIAVFLLPPRIAARAPVAVWDLPHADRWIELARGVLADEITSFDPIDHCLERSGITASRIDDRLHRAMSMMMARSDHNLPIDVIAAQAALSPSRLMALAREQLGSSLRSCRRWLRTFQVARDYASGASLTEAALDAGFASSAHLSAAAREHFGIRPSQILTPSNRGQIRAL